MIVPAVLRGAAAIVLAVLAESVSERGGVLNLGLEGFMLIAGLVGVATAVSTGSVELGFLAGGGVGLLLGAFYALLVNGLKLNQLIAGIAVYMLGVSISSMAGQGYAGTPLPQPVRIAGFEVIVLAAYLSPVIVWLALRKSGFDKLLRAVGDDPLAADMMGVNVSFVRSIACLLNGFFAGLGGALFMLVVVRTWREIGTGGIGWLSLALTPATLWEPLLAYIPGLMYSAALYAKMAGLAWFMPEELQGAFPYIVVLVVAAVVVRLVRGYAPRSLGRVYIHGSLE